MSDRIAYRLKFIRLFSLLQFAASIALIALICVPAFAQSGSSVEQTATNAFDTIYQKWRWPVCTLALVPAGFSWFSSDPRGRVRALFIMVGILFFALVPYFISIMRAWTNT